MSKIKALVTAEVVRERLEEALGDQVEFVYDGYNLDHVVMPHDELCRKVKGIEVLICEYDTISKDVFDAADKLKLTVIVPSYNMEKYLPKCLGSLVVAPELASGWRL